MAAQSTNYNAYPTGNQNFGKETEEVSIYGCRSCDNEQLKKERKLDLDNALIHWAYLIKKNIITVDTNYADRTIIWNLLLDYRNRPQTKDDLDKLIKKYYSENLSKHLIIAGGNIRTLLKTTKIVKAKNKKNAKPTKNNLNNKLNKGGFFTDTRASIRERMTRRCCKKDETSSSIAPPPPISTSVIPPVTSSVLPPPTTPYPVATSVATSLSYNPNIPLMNTKTQEYQNSMKALYPNKNISFDPGTGVAIIGEITGPTRGVPMMGNPMMGNSMMGNSMMGNQIGMPMMGNPMGMQTQQTNYSRLPPNYAMPATPPGSQQSSYTGPPNPPGMSYQSLSSSQANMSPFSSVIPGSFPGSLVTHPGSYSQPEIRQVRFADGGKLFDFKKFLKATKPTKPKKPTKAAKPANPKKPTKPSKAAKAAKPAKPTKPTKAAKAAKPAKPKKHH
jgi:hypothetical protein